MKQNLRDKAFVPFVCLVGKPLLPNLRASWWEIGAPKISSQEAINLPIALRCVFPVGGDRVPTGSKREFARGDL